MSARLSCLYVAFNFPSRGEGTLVAPEPESAGFPAIPQVSYTGKVNRLRVTD